MSDETMYRIPRVSNEENRRRIEQLRGFPESHMDAAVDPAKAEEARRRAAEWDEKLKARFAPTSDPYATLTRLGFTVGDPENERHVG